MNNSTKLIRSNGTINSNAIALCVVVHITTIPTNIHVIGKAFVAILNLGNNGLEEGLFTAEASNIYYYI